MQANWKKILEAEINDYLKNLKAFKEKWKDHKIAELINKLADESTEKVHERNAFLKSAIKHFNALKNNDKHSTAFVKETLNYLNKELKTTAVKNVLCFATDSEKKKIAKFVQEYALISPNSIEPVIYEKYEMFIRLLMVYGNICNIHYYTQTNKKDITVTSKCNQYFSHAISDLNHITSTKSCDTLENFAGFSITVDIFAWQYVIEPYKEISSCSVAPLKEEFVAKLLKNLKSTKAKSFAEFCVEEAKKHHGPEIPNSLMFYMKEYERPNDEVNLINNREANAKQTEIMNERKEIEAQRLKLEELNNEMESERLYNSQQQRRYAEMAYRQAEESSKRQEEILKQQTANQERFAAEEARRNQEQQKAQEKMARAQLEAQKKQTRAVYDTQIAELNKQMMNLHKPGDYLKRTAVKNQIDELERKRRSI